jgi:acid phosphatase (class A)
MRVLATAVFAFASAFSVAQGAAPYFLKDQVIEPRTILCAPAPENSAEARAELELILHCQRQCTPAQAARIGTQARLTPIVFQDLLGAWFTPAELPATMQLLDKVNQEAKYFCDKGKQQFLRPRPKDVDHRIKPLLERLDEPCYPSGHAVQATALALVLAELAPECRGPLCEHARQIAWNRIILGVHYPSDAVAGRILGQRVAQELLRDPAFQRELTHARHEFNQVKQRGFQPKNAGPG